MKISKWLDSAAKNLNRIKTITIIVLMLLFSISAVMNGCNRERANDLVAKITGLNIQNDILRYNLKETAAALIEEQKSRDSLMLVIHNQSGVINKQKDSIKILEREKQKILEDLLKIPVEESYEFLQTEAYPYSGERRFPFNEPQVKGIHLTYLEHQNLEKQVFSLNTLTEEQERMIALKESETQILQRQFGLAKKSMETYQELALSNEDIIETYQKHNKKLSRQAKFYRVALPVGTGLGFILGIIIAK